MLPPIAKPVKEPVIPAKVRCQMFIPPEMVERIRKIANGRSVAEVIRMAVEEFLDKHDPQ